MKRVWVLYDKKRDCNEYVSERREETEYYWDHCLGNDPNFELREEGR